MPVNIGGAYIATRTAVDLEISNGIRFGPTGAMTQVTRPAGFSGFKNTGATDMNRQSQPNVQWPINNLQFDSGHHSNGTFTAPVAGLYLCMANGIINGGSDVTAPAGYGYFGFSKNLVVTAFGHNNQRTLSSNAWAGGGINQLISCAAGDQIRFHVNTAPLPNVSPAGYGSGWGWYPDAHHSICCIRVG